MPVPQALVTRYFQLIVERQFTEAERELEHLKTKMQKTEWNRGYFRALYGIYLSRKTTGDNYSFLSKIDLTDKPAIHNYRREFLDHTRNGLHGDFDRGFFSAWADCMRVLSRMDDAAIPKTQKVEAQPETDAENAEAEKAHLETLRSDKSQATIANFLSKKSAAAADIAEDETEEE
jgi:hypothetical protein